MTLFKRLFGAGAGAADEDDQSVVYEGYTIKPDPQKSGQDWRVGAIIEKEIAGTVKTHVLIRADTAADRGVAVEMSLHKARQTIDQLGESLFG